jgi:hypothetical protein
MISSWLFLEAILFQYEQNHFFRCDLSAYSVPGLRLRTGSEKINNESLFVPSFLSWATEQSLSDFPGPTQPLEGLIFKTKLIVLELTFQPPMTTITPKNKIWVSRL